jgi:von Willebrand factor type A domain
MRFRTFLLAAVLQACAWTPAADAQQVLIPVLNSSIPFDGATSVAREIGRKQGLFFTLGYFEGITPSTKAFPLDMSNATVSVQIGGNAPLLLKPGDPNPGVAPDPGKIGFVVVTDTVSPPDQALNGVTIYYNGDFDPGAQIKYSVSGAKSMPLPAVTQSNDPNVASFTVKNDPAEPRPPVHFQLVFDISGSMGLPAVTGGSVTRIAALKNAAAVFFKALPDNAWVGDKVGVVYFSTDAKNGLAMPKMSAALDKGKMDALLADIQSQVPTAATSIGAGLNLAGAGLALETGVPKKKSVVVLFSDGEQNTAPLVAVDSTDPAKPVVKVDGTPYKVDAIIPITAGDMSAQANLLQNQIAAAKNHGNYFHVTTATDMLTGFTQSLVSILSGADKLEVVRDTGGSIKRQTKVTEEFLGNTDDTALNIVLTWSPPGITIPIRDPDSTSSSRLLPVSLPFTLRAPDGTVVDITSRTRTAPGVSVTTIRFPLPKGKTDKVVQKGKWTIELNANDPIMAKFEIAKLDYQLIVMLDNPTLASEYRVAAEDVGTGEPVPLRVKLAEKGNAVKNAAVVAQLLGPNSGLGDVLAKTTAPGGDPKYGQDKIRNAAQAKLLLLLADPANAKLFGASGLGQLVLLDDGGPASGDKKAGDGVYSGLFTAATKEGHYRFQITALGKSAQGDFQRTQTLTVFVRPKPDPKQVGLALVPAGVNPLIVGLKVAPKDRFGSFLGPDYLDLLKVTASEGKVDQALSDKLDGSYQISYRLPSASSNPTITVQVAGATVIKTTLNELRGVGQTPPRCPDIIIYDNCPPRRFLLFRRWR